VDELVDAYGELGASETKQKNMRDQLDSGTPEDIAKIIKRIEESGKGKGRFAQRLASKVDAERVPSYIRSAIERIVQEVTPPLTSSSADEDQPYGDSEIQAE
jgi:hypothetical protein